ncbi:MAG: Ig-like domain-containing protein [Pseudomonadota bacterium]
MADIALTDPLYQQSRALQLHDVRPEPIDPEALTIRGAAPTAAMAVKDMQDPQDPQGAQNPQDAQAVFVWRPILDNRQDAHIVHDVVDRRVVMEAEDGTALLQQNSTINRWNANWQVTNGFDFAQIETLNGQGWSDLTLEPGRYSGEGILWNTNPSDTYQEQPNYNMTHLSLLQRTAPLAYSFEIEPGETGNYYVGIRMIKPETPLHADRVNDVWVGFSGGLPIWNSKRAYAEDTSAFNWSKVFFNGRGAERSDRRDSVIKEEQFHWTTWGPTVGSIPFHRVRFEEPGTYSMYVAARSALVGIDQIQLFHQGTLTADGTNIAENFVLADATKPASPVTTATVEGYFFVDLDGDGVRDAAQTDPAVVDRAVELRAGNTLVATTKTDATGLYRFEDVAPGSGYQLRFYHVEGDSFLPVNGQTVGSGGNLNTAAFSLSAGESLRQVNAMLAAPPVLKAPEGTPYYKAVATADGYRFKFQIEDAGTDPAGKWSFVNAPDGAGNQAGFQGSGYYVYGTPNPPLSRNGVNDAEILTYTIYVPEGAEGVYNFRIRVSRDGNAESDKENDLWLNFGKVGAPALIDPFLVGLGGSQPEPTSKGFLKVYGGPNNGSWGHATFLDGAPSNLPVKLDIDQAGFYQVLIAGRSEGFHVDGFELYTGSAPGDGVANSPMSLIGGPDAVDDSVSVKAEGRATKLNPLANDSDAETARADLSLVAVGDAGKGTATIVRSKVFYKPDKGARGSDSFTYTVEDEDGYQSTATVHVDIDASGVLIGGLETGTVSVEQSSAKAWFKVRFSETIENAVVVMGPVSANANAPVVARVRDVTDKGFRFQIDEWDYLNGVHGLETVSWMAASAGTHRLSDGTVIQAGTEQVANQTVASASFDKAFSETPLLFTQVASVNDPSAVTTRIRSVDSDGFRVRIQEEEAADGAHLSEEIDWIAIESRDSLAFNHTGTLTADEQWGKLKTGAPAPGAVLLAEMQTLNGFDTAALRYQERPNGYVVMVQEESSQDSEINHATETLAYLVGQGGAFDLYG